MIFHKYLLFFSLMWLVSARCFAESKITIESRDDDVTKALIQKYLSNSDSVEFKIKELNDLARVYDEKGQYSAEIKSLQTGMALEKYIQKPAYLTFELNTLMGNVLSGYSPGAALYFYNKAMSIGLIADDISPRDKSQMYGSMAGSFMEVSKFDSALIIYKLGALEEEKLSGNLPERASALNNIGMFYASMGNTDSARFYYDRALAMLGGIRLQPVLYCGIRDNMAQLMEKTGDFSRAIKIFQFNDSVYFSSHQKTRYVLNKVRLLEAMEKSGLTGIASEINSLARFIDTSGEYIARSEVLNFYRFAVGYFLKENKNKKVNYFRKRFLDLNDSIAKKNVETYRLITRALLNLQSDGFKSELDVREMELHLARQSNVYQRLIAVIIILSACVIIILLISYISGRRKQHEAERKAHRSELERQESELRSAELKAVAMQQEIELKKKDITNIVLYNTKVYDSNKMMINELNRIIKRGEGLEGSVKTLIMELKGKEYVGENRIVMQQNIDSVNAEFYSNLESRIPGLTQSEKELCGYIRINLSNKDISILKNIEAASVKTSKTRLRKKLGLSPDDDLHGFMLQI